MAAQFSRNPPPEQIRGLGYGVKPYNFAPAGLPDLTAEYEPSVRLIAEVSAKSDANMEFSGASLVRRLGTPTTNWRRAEWMRQWSGCFSPHPPGPSTVGSILTRLGKSLPYRLTTATYRTTASTTTIASP